MADQTRTSRPEELHRAIRDIEGEYSRLDVILANVHAELSRLISKLRQLCAPRRDAKAAALSRTEPLMG